MTIRLSSNKKQDGVCIMADTIAQSVASIVAAILQGRSSRLSENDLRMLSHVASSSRDATLALGGISAALAAVEATRRIPGPDVGPIFPAFDEGPTPITPGPYPPDFPQPIEPGPPDNPAGPQPIDSGGFTHPWHEQMVRYVALDEFLVPAELEALSQFALDNEDKFEASQVVTPGSTAGGVDFDSRRSRVLTQLGNLGDMFRERVRHVLPLVAQRLGMTVRNATGVDVQMTASNDGEFFVAHADNGPAFPTRAISYVYFFNKEPAAFTGGTLRLYDGQAVRDGGAPSRFTAIVPAQNQIVFFPSPLVHEVRPVSVPSGAFEDSRFTVNGWVHF